MNQTQEAARQILGRVSDIQAITSMSGMAEVNLMLADIRDKASVLYDDGETNGQEIVAGYEAATDEAMCMLGEKIRLSPLAIITDADRRLILRLAEIFVSRSRVYFDRKTRLITEG